MLRYHVTDQQTAHSPIHSTEVRLLNAQDLSHTVVDLLDDKLAEDILLLDISEISPFADYFVIATATSERQSQALVDGLGG